MLITLYGPDSYRRLKKLNEIIKIYKEKHSGLSHERFDLGENGSFLAFKNFIGTRSMFDQTQLVVLDNILECQNKKELKEILKKYINEKSTTIVANFDKKPTEIGFLMKEPSQSQEYPKLKEDKLIAFIKKESKEHGISLDAETQRALAEMFGGDTWSIVTEIKRMSLASDKELKYRPSGNYFALMNALKRGRSIADRLNSLEVLLVERGDDPARVFNSVAYKLRDEKEAKKFADYDVAIKSGKLEYEEVLLDIALGI